MKVCLVCFTVLGSEPASKLSSKNCNLRTIWYIHQFKILCWWDDNAGLGVKSTTTFLVDLNLMQPLETLEYRKKQKIELIEMTTGFIDDPAAVLLLRVGAYKSDLIVCPPPFRVPAFTGWNFCHDWLWVLMSRQIKSHRILDVLFCMLQCGKTLSVRLVVLCRVFQRAVLEFAHDRKTCLVGIPQ